MKRIFLILLALVLALSIGIVGCTAPAEEEEEEEEEEPEEIVIKFGSAAPEFYSVIQDVVLPWQDEITDETNGVVQWENYFGTLVSATDCYAEIQAGLVDAGHIQSVYEPSGFEIAKRISLFYIGVPSMEACVEVFKELAETFPEIDAEFSEVKLLENGSTSPLYNLMTAEIPVYSLTDLAGMQLRAYSYHIPALEALGAAGLQMPMFDVYNSLETGVIDGLVGTSEALKTLNLADVVKYHTTLNVASGCGYSTAMNLDIWNSLPQDIQQVFEDNRQLYSDLMVEQWNDVTAEGIAFGALAGVEFIELAPEELEELHNLIREAAVAFAEELDGMGLPGTEIYTEAQRLIAEY